MNQQQRRTPNLPSYEGFRTSGFRNETDNSDFRSQSSFNENQQPPMFNNRQRSYIDDYQQQQQQNHHQQRLIEDSSQYDAEHFRNDQPISISFRNNILDQCNDQYQMNIKSAVPTKSDISPATTTMREASQPRATLPFQLEHSHSPYRQTESVSPNRLIKNGQEEDAVDEIVQGNIDSAMAETQIRNKKAFVWAFGKNQEGELALGVYKDALLPRFVTGIKNGSCARWLASSNHHTAMVTVDGGLFVCGSSLHGKLGLESNINKTNINRFQQVLGLSMKKVKQVACGDYNTLALTEEGTVYQFGGQLFKDKKGASEKRPASANAQPQGPQPLQALYGKDIVQIDCGDFHSVALDSNGDLYSWGGGAQAYNKGQCGHGHTNAIEQPEKVKFIASKRVIKVACGGFHTLVLTNENEVYAFGAGQYGECGYGEFLDTSKPKLVKFPQRNNVDMQGQNDYALEMYMRESVIISDIAAGGRHSLAITDDGQLFSWGYGTNGQLGLRSTSNKSKPHLVKDLKKVVQVAAGWNHSLALTANGDLYACGYGAHGQLGLGDKESKTQFTLIAALANKNIEKIFAGGSHSWVVLNALQPIRDQATIVLQQEETTTPVRAQMTTEFNNSDGKPSNVVPKKLAEMSPFQQKSYDKQQQQPLPGASDDFIQKVLDVQAQQLQKSQYFVQVTYCFETEFCHRFVNFEVHENFISQVENQLLEDYIQAAYQQEKGGMLYHKLQEVPVELYERSKRQALKQVLTPGEKLFKDVMSDDDLMDEFYGAGGLEQKKKFKAFTLCMICNPARCGYDQIFNQCKSSVRSAKRITVSSQAYQNSAEDAPLVGKIVFKKDIDIEQNDVEEAMCRWVAQFHRKIAKFCVKKPRYSELRPMRFSLY